MLVVVVAVDRVQVVTVPEVGVSGMRGRCVTAAAAMDVHVASVREVRRRALRTPFVHVVPVGVMDMSVMEEVEMVVVDDLGVPAPPVMDMRVRRVRVVGVRGVEAHGRGHGGTTRDPAQ